MAVIAPPTRFPEDRDEPNFALPQLSLRLVGIVSIGLGTGLTTADVAPAVVVAAFLPAVVALVVVAVRASLGAPIDDPDGQETTIDGRQDRQGAPDLT